MRLGVHGVGLWADVICHLDLPFASLVQPRWSSRVLRTPHMQPRSSAALSMETKSPLEYKPPHATAYLGADARAAQQEKGQQLQTLNVPRVCNVAGESQ